MIEVSPTEIGTDLKLTSDANALKINDENQSNNLNRLASLE